MKRKIGKKNLMYKNVVQMNPVVLPLLQHELWCYFLSLQQGPKVLKKAQRDDFTTARHFWQLLHGPLTSVSLNACVFLRTLDRACLVCTVGGL